ncbi:HAD family hydrolase [uncultured Clostridium sp.]|uniref:HAD family hydrolase n=1 Tax=uncultured Clostridium sp. TaxID=59620 RepID=UPI0025E81C69|nr:HAD family hydrolase [uncultured Clostridium sp.]
MKKYILFDLDGTLTDPMLGITKSVKYALDKFNIHVNGLDELCKFIGPPLKDSFMEFYNFSEEEAEKGVTFYRERYSTKGIYENIVYGGIERLLKELKDNNKTIIIATSKPTVFAKEIVDYFKLGKYFDFICGSNLDGTRSKKVEVIEYALKIAGVKDRSEAIMIGDRKHDIIGAKLAKLESIGVLYGYGDFEELKKSGADYIVETVNELESLLSKL